MAWQVTKPASTDILATSQGDILANFVAIEDVLGSGTLAAGITITAGDILYASAANTLTVLAKGTAGQVLTMNAGGTAPEWKTP